MVKIVEAPKNVPASEKAAALYTGIQKRNESIRKDLEKQQESQLWKELGGGLLKMGYESIMDQRLAEKSANFFANEEYLSNQALASKAMTNATSHLARNEAANKYKDGAQAYWKNYWVDNIYLPKINKFAVDSTDPKDLAALRSIAAQHVEQDFADLWENKEKMDSLAFKVKGAAGDENLTQFYKAWDAARKHTGTVETQRLSELGRLAFGKNEPINPGTLLTSNKSLQQMTQTFTEFNSQYAQHISQGLDQSKAEAMRLLAQELPNKPIELEVFETKVYDEITESWVDQKFFREPNSLQVWAGQLVDQKTGETTSLNSPEINVARNADFFKNEQTYKRVLPTIEKNLQHLDKEDIAIRDKLIDEKKKITKSRGGNDDAVFKAAEKQLKINNQHLYINYDYLDRKFKREDLSPAVLFKMAGSLDRIIDNVKTNGKYRAVKSDGTPQDRKVSYEQLMDFHIDYENPIVLLAAVNDRIGNFANQTPIVSDLFKEIHRKFTTYSNPHSKMRDIVAIQQFVEGHSMTPKQGFISVENYNKLVNLAGNSTLHKNNTELTNYKTFLLPEPEKEIKVPEASRAGDILEGDIVIPLRPDADASSSEDSTKIPEDTFDPEYEAKYDKSMEGVQLTLSKNREKQQTKQNLQAIRETEKNIAALKARIIKLEANPEQAQAKLTGARRPKTGSREITVLESAQQKLKELEANRVRYISSLPTLTEQ